MNSKIFERFREYINTAQFNALRISIASPERIKSLSYGEVKKIETINYRTLKPERDGLFCARIFGPQKDWECNCGKYKRMKHRGVTCEKCGVEVIQSRVRRERMGHINLVSSVCHIWFLKGIPSYLSLILSMTVRDLERVIYFDSYIVVHQGDSPYAHKTLLTSLEYDDYVRAHPEDTLFKAEMGAEAIKLLLGDMDLDFEVRKIEQDLEKTSSIAVKHKLGKRYKVLSRMLKAEINPQWVVMDILPVIPPDLRPLVPLEGGRFASSDLNDLYRRVLNRNIRLRRLMELEAPDVIVKNEKRMLQESVDALIDNGRRGQPVRGGNKRPLKSLSEMLRGKQGRFRQNLLGKRVDYSGRSVIIVQPELKLSQCGLPKSMALELFKPYVYVELQRRELAPNLRVTKKMVEDMTPEVWEALEEVVKNRPVLLNRAPTLHRLGMQAFYPILVEGKAIKVHPLVCAAFNADFDGDTMSVHVPLSKKAQEEARTLMLATKNLLSAANGKPIVTPSQDMVLGLYYITKARKNVPGEGLTFSSIGELMVAYQRNVVNIHARIKLRLYDGSIVDTTVGRSLVYEMLPEETPFEWLNHPLKKRDIVKLISRVHRMYGQDRTVEFLDALKTLGFSHSTQAGLSLSVDDLLIPDEKVDIVASATDEVARIEGLYADGAITNGERYNKVIQTWARATDDVASSMISALEKQDHEEYLNESGRSESCFNPVFLMLDSGARSSKQQIRQLGGMRGLMAKPSGEIMEIPVLANFKDGLNVFEYFISTSGARKGLADTALKTADSGYLTRRLVDVAQDVVVTEEDCSTLGSVVLTDMREGGVVIEPLEARIFGRVIAEDVIDPIGGETVAQKGEVVTQSVVERVKASSVTEISVRSVLTCQARRGVCAQCYGLDLSTTEMVRTGLAVGIIAAQSIGEPGTQLTMRTFHVGGTASLEQNSGYKSSYDGVVLMRNIVSVTDPSGNDVVVSRKGKIIITAEDGRELEVVKVEYGSYLKVKDKAAVKKGDVLILSDPENKVIIANKGGRVRFADMVENITYQEKLDDATGKSRKVILERKEEKRQPCILLVDEAGEELSRYYLPTAAHIYVEDDTVIAPGTVIAKLGRSGLKTRDITGGLPRVAELFEARIAKDAAIISEATGQVRFEGLIRGNRKISVITEDGEVFDYSVPRSKHLNVSDGDFVSVGDPITAGNPNVHDILRIMGPDALQKYLVKGIQEIYCLQGVTINDKHIELIIRQMLRKVRISSSGETDFVMGDRVDKVHFQKVNQIMLAEGKKVATAAPILMGITKASLGTDSVISAASFQETTRVLAEAAIEGKVDYLYGLKENVIIGKLIPAGTGVKSFRLHHLGEDVSELEQQARGEEAMEVALDKISLEPLQSN